MIVKSLRTLVSSSNRCSSPAQHHQHIEQHYSVASHQHVHILVICFISLHIYKNIISSSAPPYGYLEDLTLQRLEQHPGDVDKDLHPMAQTLPVRGNLDHLPLVVEGVPDNCNEEIMFKMYDSQHQHLSMTSPLEPAEPNSLRAVRLTWPRRVMLVTAAPTIWPDSDNVQ